MKNPIIETRLNQMIAKKSQLLKMKKSERGNQLKQIEKTIATLKRWIQDPNTHVPDPTPEPQRIHFPMMTNVIDAMTAFGKAIGNIEPDQRKTPEQIREMIVNVENDGEWLWPKKQPALDPETKKEFERMNQIELSTITDDEQRVATALKSWQQYNEPKRQETTGNHTETIPNGSKDSNIVPERDQWRLMSVESAFQRMNGNR